ncbi:MAG: patatin-like phospholipase family protein [Rhizobiaceae bacterium]
MNIKRVIAIFTAVLLLTACVTTRPEESPATRALVPLEAVLVTDAPQFGAGTGSHSDVDGDGIHNVLALSSGGAEGAYGAGVMKGWTETGTRPEFDVVSGVSTGALIAVLAFLGPEYDDELERFYTETRARDVYRIRGPLSVLSDSLLDNSPLKASIEAVVTRELLDKVAAEHRKGRRLYVATTNLDAGDLVIWDMGDVALGGRSNDVQFFQKILRASAAIPGLFPPVYIKPVRGIQKRQAHVDGGLKAPVLIGDYMFPADAKSSNLYVVINDFTTRLNDSTPIRASLLSIARKSIAELMRELLEETVFRGFVLSRQIGAEFYLTSIPQTVEMSDQSLNFDPERNRKLFEAGRKAGQAGADTWHRSPPRANNREKRLASN